MNTFRRYCRHAYILHGYLIAMLILMPVPQVNSYWTDSDQDGVKEWVEGPAPEDSWWAEDSDGDSMSNAEELVFGSDPLSRDSDRDGLSDLVERDYTPLLTPFNPWNWDSDGNGFSDHDQYYQSVQGYVPVVNYTVLGSGNFYRYWDADGDGVYNHLDSDPVNMDRDGDGLRNWEDSYMDDETNGYVPPPPSEDSDNDGLTDDVDPFPWGSYTYNNVEYGGTWVDSDGDDIPDAQDSFPNGSYFYEDVEYALPLMDQDGDGVPDPADPFPSIARSYTYQNVLYAGVMPDRDGDGLPDWDDAFPDGSYSYLGVEYAGALVDPDGDGIPSAFDPFPLVAGSYSYQGFLYGGALPDRDGDGKPDWDDAFPDGSYIYLNVEYAGAWVDPDGDGIPSDFDPFPLLSGSYMYDGVTYGGAWVDQDGDGIPDPADPFPSVSGSYWYNSTQYPGTWADNDGDGIPNAQDSFPDGSYWYNFTEYAGAWVDSDGDGVPNAQDAFPNGSYIYNSTEYAGTWADNDGDGIPNALDAFPDGSYSYNGTEYAGAWMDSDMDGIPNAQDAFPNGSFNYNGVEYGGYWMDSDSDSIPDPADPFPNMAGSYTYNGTEYGGYWVDSDSDGIPNAQDSWPNDWWNNAPHFNYNGTEYAGYITDDRDGDAVPDLADSWPDDPENGLDSDNDGLSNYAERTAHHTKSNDVDSDDDFLTDYEELLTFHTNPLAPRTNLSEGQTLLDGEMHLGVDSDADGLPDLLENFYTMLGYALSNSNAADAAGDLDSDGKTNLQAYHLGWSLIANLPVYDQDGDGIDDAIEDYWNAVYHGSMSKAVFEDAVADYDEDGLMNYEEVYRIRIGCYLVPLDPGDARSIMTALDYPNTSATITDGQFMAWQRAGHAIDVLEDAAPANGRPDGYDSWMATPGRENPPHAVAPDEDGDGMPNVWEYRYDLNLRDGTDAGYLYAQQTNSVGPPGAEPQTSDPQFYVDDVYDSFAYEIAAQLYSERLTNYNAAEVVRLRCDPDNDGLSNVREFLLGTHPRIADTDGDGFSDYAEATYGGDPLAAGSKPPVVFSLVSGGGQTVARGNGAALPLAVSVTQAGVGVGGISVTFTTVPGIVWPGTGLGAARTLQTGSNGVAEVQIAAALSAVAGSGNMVVSAPGFADILVPVTTTVPTTGGGGTTGGGTTGPVPTPNSPPPPARHLFTAWRVKSVSFSAKESVSHPTETTELGSTTRWYKPGSQLPPPPPPANSDDGFNGDADLEGVNEDPGDPRDDIQIPSAGYGPREDASQGDEFAYPETSYNSYTTNTGPYEQQPGAMTGEYKAGNAYDPPDVKTVVGGNFSHSQALTALAGVNYYRGADTNGWQGNGPNGLKGYEVASTLTSGTEWAPEITYIDEEDEEQTSTVEYSTENASIAQAEVRLQTNTAVTAADLAEGRQVSAVFVLSKKTVEGSSTTKEMQAVIKLMIISGMKSNAQEIISSVLPEKALPTGVTVQGGVVSMKSPVPVMGKTVSYDLLPVEVVDLAPKLKDETGTEIADSNKPIALPKANGMVEEDAANNRIAHRELKVSIGSALKDKKVTWSMEAKFTPTGSSQPRFRGDWATAAEAHRNRFEASTTYGANGFTEDSQEQAKTTVDANGFTAIRVNVPPWGLNKARIKIQIEGTTTPIDLIDLEVPGVIVIDPGHGIGPAGSSNEIGGTGVATGAQEHAIALDIGTRMAADLRRRRDAEHLPIKVFMTRTGATNQRFIDRTRIARENGCDVYISIHFNSVDNVPTRRHPFGMWDATGNLNLAEDQALARRVRQAVQRAILAVEPAESRDAPTDGITSETHEANLQKGLDTLSDSTDTNTPNFNGNIAGHTPCRAMLMEMEWLGNTKADLLFSEGNTTLSATANSMREEAAQAMADAAIEDLQTQPAQ